MNLTSNLSYLPENTRKGLQFADSRWQALRNNNLTYPTVITNSKETLNDFDADIIICGGTLGILIATSLQKQGYNVILIEKGKLRGREQEWNISRQELSTFVELELLSNQELEKAIATEYNPGRVSFHKGYELWVEDVLNIGVDPVFLLETLKNKFLEAGGKLLENTPFDSGIIYDNGVSVNVGNTVIKSRLLMDGMGHFSPIVQQARKGDKPDGICLVVGSCAQGYTNNNTGDLIASFTPILNQCQYFWEAFPARDGRTTYLFTYVDAHPDRFSLEFFMEEYLRLLPEYQNIDLEKLQFERFLFGFFPAYQNSPLKMPWDRILPIGDSAGGQSPVSFGGFGSMVRNLKRLTLGIDEALKVDSLDKKSLSLLQPYQPNISVTWLFQKTMSVAINQKVSPNQINDLMSGVFQVMDQLGDEVLKPFLQDVIQFPALMKTLPLVNPKLVLPILPQVGVQPLLDWTTHYLSLAAYSGLYPLGKWVKPLTTNLSPQQQYYYHRWLDSWKYGSGGDYNEN
ncbi:MAG: FAD-binding oxidoreductase [Crocosphaera sp.]|uniref:FAD-dependent oxidoreductase n=1 Tax=Crocosphaera sp. TaxID=2729996 RepID=UPI00257F8661|nr:FAD-binding oxidoreductase [Crocosphaera sp.]MCH2244336.1 FAD-binding oxidoreductase [Crocosphaera sp.]NQZ61118.1 FAD-binding oxidoreductase [Crocosphaera sp.]